MLFSSRELCTFKHCPRFKDYAVRGNQRLLLFFDSHNKAKHKHFFLQVVKASPSQWPWARCLDLACLRSCSVMNKIFSAITARQWRSLQLLPGLPKRSNESCRCCYLSSLAVRRSYGERYDRPQITQYPATIQPHSECTYTLDSSCKKYVFLMTYGRLGYPAPSLPTAFPARSSWAKGSFMHNLCAITVCQQSGTLSMLHFLPLHGCAFSPSLFSSTNCSPARHHIIFLVAKSSFRRSPADGWRSIS